MPLHQDLPQMEAQVAISISVWTKMFLYHIHYVSDMKYPDNKYAFSIQL
jgi:hypothetical protein